MVQVAGGLREWRGEGVGRLAIRGRLGGGAAVAPTPCCCSRALSGVAHALQPCSPPVPPQTRTPGQLAIPRCRPCGPAAHLRHLERALADDVAHVQPVAQRVCRAAGREVCGEERARPPAAAQRGRARGRRGRGTCTAGRSAVLGALTSKRKRAPACEALGKLGALPHTAAASIITQPRSTPQCKLTRTNRPHL